MQIRLYLPAIVMMKAGRALFSAFLTAAALLFPCLLSAQIEDPEDVFRELRTLEGTWFMPTDRGDRLESWSIADDSTLVGRDFRIKPENGDTVTLENMRLELRDTNIFYVAIVRGQNQNRPIYFKLTEADYEGYLFENPEHDDPQKIRYLLLGNRELQVTTEGKRNNRPVKHEYVFEREFTPGSVEFRVRGGINAHTLRGTGYFPSDTPDDKPVFGWKPGWEIGAQAVFKGRGGFVSINCELSLTGKSAHAKSAFTVVEDTILNYKRDGTYNTIWLNVAVAPEITFKRDGRLSLIVGPYMGLLLSSRMKGTIEPQGEKGIFNANEDFKKFDFGAMAGFQYKLNFGKKDIGGKLGIRANIGLADLDNLYIRGSSSTALGNGRISFLGAALYYSFNLLKL